MLRTIFETHLCLLAEYLPKQPKLWVFGSWFGQAYADNPKALFEYVVKTAPHIKPIWITFNQAVYQKLRAAQLPVALAQSWLGKWYMLRAETAVFSTGYTTDFKASCIGSKTKKIQLWHGAGLKKIGTIPKTSQEKPALYDLVTASSQALRQRAIDEFKIDPAAAVVTGMPRLDVLAKPTKKLTAVAKAMKKQRELGQTVVLCAFTHRFDAKSSILHRLLKEAKQLSPDLQANQIKLYIKPHFYDTYLYGDDLADASTQDGPIVIVSNHEIEHDILSLFKQADILLTDYSSTFTDFLLTEKPTIFFDAEHTAHHQKFYFDFATHSPGPKVSSWVACLAEIKRFRQKPERFLPARRRMRKFFHQFTDGKNTERVLRAIEHKLG